MKRLECLRIHFSETTTVTEGSSTRKLKDYLAKKLNLTQLVSLKVPCGVFL